MITGLVAGILGVVAAWIVFPRLQDGWIIADLGSDDVVRRDRAILRAAGRARHRPAFLRRLESALDDPDDVRFTAVAEALSRIGRFPPAEGPAAYQDRYQCLSLAGVLDDADATGQRTAILHEFTRVGRDNAHIRRCLSLAAGDREPDVRTAAALLAARLGDGATLARLLNDDAPLVRAAAALDAALANRFELAGPIARVLAAAADDSEKANAAYALARLARNESARPIAEAISQARKDGKGELLGKLLHVAALPAAGGTRRRLQDDFGIAHERAILTAAVLAVFKAAEQDKADPPTMALVAAGRLSLTEARPYVRSAIEAVLAADKTELTVADAQRLAAAVHAASRLHMEPALEVRVIRELWHPGTDLAMILAAEGLALAPASAGGEGGLTDEQIAAVLVKSAEYDSITLPSAAAAVALYRRAPERAVEHLRTACESKSYLVGDYVAWGISALAPPPGDASWNPTEAYAHARTIALRFLSSPEINRNVRSAGALTLALLARGGGLLSDTGPRRAVDEAFEVISGKLRGGALGPERDPYLVGSYQCALLILGRSEFAQDVLTLVQRTDFPKGRALTALALAGRDEGFDMVFAWPAASGEWIDSIMTGWMMGRVYAGLAADLPVHDLDAPAGVRNWQCTILRHYYLIHRRNILDRMKP